MSQDKRENNHMDRNLPFELPKNPPSYEETMCIDLCLKPHMTNNFTHDYFQRYIRGEFVDFNNLGNDDTIVYFWGSEDNDARNNTTRNNNNNTLYRNNHPYRHNDNSFSHGNNDQLEYEEK